MDITFSFMFLIPKKNPLNRPAGRFHFFIFPDLRAFLVTSPIFLTNTSLILELGTKLGKLCNRLNGLHTKFLKIEIRYVWIPTVKCGNDSQSKDSRS